MYQSPKVENSAFSGVFPLKALFFSIAIQTEKSLDWKRIQGLNLM